ncbi:MAG: aminotransferase class I/II-fold pyridoxal phosphate-dependent enzyme, partial [Clostridia bacterium]|nr:aminotransferase class I/II-fold pyridoxal phosphate-dependent enzyme [Clostridia bacterium]
MEFDFTTILDRRGKDAMAVEVIPFAGAEIKEGFSRLPMWVADMNFNTAPAVIEAVQKRLEHGTFGYFPVREEYYDAIINWQKTRHGVDVAKENISNENGVLASVVAVLDAFTTPGEKVLAHSPCYVGFTGAITGAGRTLVYSEMKRDENGIWRMDYEDMDRKLKENHIHVAVFCSPHNPTGRVWEKWEIEKAMEVYAANDCIVVSDEIWADIVMEGHKHIPTQSVSEDAKNRTVACYAITKTFNLAGCSKSYRVVYHKFLKDGTDKASHGGIHVLSMHALMGAYSDAGARWVDELNHVLTQNVNYVCDYVNDKFPGVSVSRGQGTYMLYLDCSEWLKAHPDVSMDDLLRRGYSVGVIWQDGRGFKIADTIRLNLALPHELVKQAMDRLDKYV